MFKGCVWADTRPQGISGEGWGWGGGVLGLLKGPVSTHLFTDELLPQELAGLEHVRDVVEWTEAFVFVFVLVLNRKGGKMGGGGHRGEKVIRKAFPKPRNLTHPSQMRTFQRGAQAPPIKTQICTQWLCLPPPPP